MNGSNVVFCNSIEEDLNIESWVSNTQNFCRGDNFDEHKSMFLNKKRGVGTRYNSKNNKRNIVDNIAKELKVKNKQRIAKRNIVSAQARPTGILLEGRVSSILSTLKSAEKPSNTSLS